MALRVSGVMPESIAEELGIAAGDTLLMLAGEPLQDIIDYLALEANESFSVIWKTKEGIEESVEIEKDIEEPLGLLFEGDGLGKSRGCANACVFCFVDQLPQNMRETLYFKDDDWRLSFIMGNYVTLTNVGEKEFDRILKRKPSPLYVSVHATEEAVRQKMLGRKYTRTILETLQALKEAGISFHMQAVVCPGLNDGAVLEKTIADLAALMPNALSLALVPVGITGHRAGLYPLKQVTKEEARRVIQIAGQWQEKLRKMHGTRFVFVADEFYIRAELPFPAAETYEEFGQLEDGVGMTSLFMEEVKEGIQAFAGKKNMQKGMIATGIDAAPYITWAANACNKAFGTDISVRAIQNNFFGESITITGLLTGADILAQLKGEELTHLFLCEVMLRDRKNVFLDDMTIEALSEALGVPITIVPSDGFGFVETLIGV